MNRQVEQSGYANGRMSNPMDPVNIVRSADAITDWEADRVERASSTLRAFELAMTEAINNLVKFLGLVDCGTRKHP